MFVGNTVFIQNPRIMRTHIAEFYCLNHFFLIHLLILSLDKGKPCQIYPFPPRIRLLDRKCLPIRSMKRVSRRTTKKQKTNRNRVPISIPNKGRETREKSRAILIRISIETQAEAKNSACFCHAHSLRAEPSERLLPIRS